MTVPCYPARLCYQAALPSNNKLGITGERHMTTEVNESTRSLPLAGEPIPNRNTSLLELTKTILEFVSKCLYPAILVSVLVLLWPSLSAVDLKKLIDRLQSAKAGDYEFTFSQAQDVGAEIAPLNGKIVELEKALTIVQADLKRAQESGNSIKPTDEQVKARAVAEKKFKANSDYTVLVFHSVRSRSTANTVTDAFLKSGYKSSDTETDFSELQKVKPEPNVIFITYTQKGEEILPNIEESIKLLAPGVEVRRNPRPINLRRGDLQVFVF